MFININKVFSKELDEQQISETRNHLNAFGYTGKGVITNDKGVVLKNDEELRITDKGIGYELRTYPYLVDGKEF